MDVTRISSVILIIDGAEWVLKKKKTITNFCYDYLDANDPSIKPAPLKKSPKTITPKKKPKSILKVPSKPKKKVKPPSSSSEDEESDRSFDFESSSKEETEEESPPKKSKKKKKEQKPGYAKLNISYSETKGDVMKAAKEMAKNAGFE